MNTYPLVSIILSVYNSEEFIEECISSVLMQSYKNFEFIIVDDGSTDGSKDIINKYTDSRIILVDNQTNMGLAASLNRAIRMSKGEYIARMDADDICLKTRFEQQISFLEKNPEVDICGSFISRINSKGKVFRRKSKSPIRNNDIKAGSIFSPRLFHPTVVFRSSSLQTMNMLYDESYSRAQDFELWSRLIFKKNIVFHNLPIILLKYRDNENLSERANRNQKQSVIASDIRSRNLIKLGIVLPRHIELFNNLICENSLTKYQLLSLIFLLRQINNKSQELFGAFPRIDQLKAIYPLGVFKSIYLIFYERLYRNMGIKSFVELLFLSVNSYLNKII